MDASVLNKKINRATKWSAITEITTKLITPITNMVLARLLVPSVFGVVTTITMVITFAEVFTDAGFQKYIIQHEFNDENDLNKSTNVAFWTNLALSVFIWVIISIFSNPIASLVGSPGYGTSIIIASLSIPVASFSSIQLARYKRDFNFKVLFITQTTISLIPLIVTVPLAIIFKSHWALIIGTLSKNIVNAFLLTILSKWKPKFTYSFKKLKEMLSFSVLTILEMLATWCTINLDIFIVSRFLDSHYIGLYKTAMTTVGTYMQIIAHIFVPVCFSALSRAQNDEALFKSLFYKYQRLLSLFMIPMGIGMFIYKELVTNILLGPAWSEITEFIGLYAIFGCFDLALNFLNSEVYRSKGRPLLSLLFQVLICSLIITNSILFAGYDFKLLYTIRSLIRIINVVIGLIMMWGFFKFSPLKSILNILPMIISSTIMGIAGYFFVQLSANMVWQIISVIICMLIYFVVMCLFPKIRKEYLPVIFKNKNFNDQN